MAPIIKDFTLVSFRVTTVRPLAKLNSKRPVKALELAFLRTAENLFRGRDPEPELPWTWRDTLRLVEALLPNTASIYGKMTPDNSRKFLAVLSPDGWRIKRDGKIRIPSIAFVYQYYPA